MEERARAFSEERHQRFLEEQSAIGRLAELRRQEEESVARRKSEEAEVARLLTGITIISNANRLFLAGET
jgi:hypothetical protein